MRELLCLLLIAYCKTPDDNTCNQKSLISKLINTNHMGTVEIGTKVLFIISDPDNS